MANRTSNTRKPDAEVRILGNVSSLSGKYWSAIGKKAKNPKLHAIFRPELFPQFGPDFSFLALHAGPYDVERDPGETHRDIAEWFVGEELGDDWEVMSAKGIPSRATPTGWAYDLRASAFELEHKTASIHTDPRVELSRSPDKRLEMGFYVAVYFPPS